MDVLLGSFQMAFFQNANGQKSGTPMDTSEWMSRIFQRNK